MRIDSGRDTHETGVERNILSRVRLQGEDRHPGRIVRNPLHIAKLQARAFLHRFTEQKPIEPRRPAIPPAGQRALYTEYIRW